MQLSMSIPPPPPPPPPPLPVLGNKRGFDKFIRIKIKNKKIIFPDIPDPAPYRGGGGGGEEGREGGEEGDGVDIDRCISTDVARSDTPLGSNPSIGNKLGQ